MVSVGVFSIYSLKQFASIMKSTILSYPFALNEETPYHVIPSTLTPVDYRRVDT